MAAICWAIWNARHERVWQQKYLRIASIVASAKGYLNQWRISQNSDFESSWPNFQKGDGVEQCSSPQVDSIKVNVNTTLFEDFNCYGFNFVARDDKGFFVEGCTKLIHGLVSPTLVEEMDIRETLNWIKDHQWQHVSPKSDCLTAMQALRSSIRMISIID
uniref:RNase H type-1 domain-containing protein n=1 Tax=Cannabis sativa TaxID=3483 RepID=A0A803NX02_CANSA